jgi:hypothetical protein
MPLIHNSRCSWLPGSIAAATPKKNSRSTQHRLLRDTKNLNKRHPSSKVATSSAYLLPYLISALIECVEIEPWSPNHDTLDLLFPTLTSLKLVYSLILLTWPRWTITFLTVVWLRMLHGQTLGRLVESLQPWKNVLRVCPCSCKLCLLIFGLLHLCLQGEKAGTIFSMMRCNMGWREAHKSGWT